MEAFHWPAVRTARMRWRLGRGDSSSRGKGSCMLLCCLVLFSLRIHRHRLNLQLFGEPFEQASILVEEPALARAHLLELVLQVSRPRLCLREFRRHLVCCRRGGRLTRLGSSGGTRRLRGLALALLELLLQHLNVLAAHACILLILAQQLQVSFHHVLLLGMEVHALLLLSRLGLEGRDVGE